MIECFEVVEVMFVGYVVEQRLPSPTIFGTVYLKNGSIVISICDEGNIGLEYLVQPSGY